MQAGGRGGETESGDCRAEGAAGADGTHAPGAARQQGHRGHF